MHMKRTHLAGFLIGAFCLMSSWAGAQQTDRLAGLIDSLGSSSWAQRDQATLELAGLSDEIPLSQLEAALQDPSLTLEQRTRLYQACVLRFGVHPKGGLGVAFGKIQVGAIELQPIQNDPRFPASALLNPGDELAMIDNQIATSIFNIRAQILSREPGELLAATIIRADQVLHLDLPLGSFTQLAGAARLDPALVERALAARWERRGIVVPSHDVIGSTIDLDQWIGAAFPPNTTPDPHVPVRRMSTAMVADSQVRTITGYPRTPATNKPYMNPGLIRQRAQAIEQKYTGYDQQILNARLRLSTIQRDMALNEINALTNDPDKASQAGHAQKLGELQRVVEEMNKAIDAYEEASKRGPANQGTNGKE